MNKLFWFFIVWLLLAIWGIIYSDYNSQFADFLCQKIQYCNHSIKDQSVRLSYNSWDNRDIIHTVSEVMYPEVWFYKDNNWDQLMMQQYADKWKKCKKESYWIAWSLDGCENITGYAHTYTINRLGIKLWTYSNSRPTSTDNPWIFRKDLIEPFLLSWNRIYEQEWTGLFTRYSYIEYREFKTWETKEILLSGDIDNIQLIGSEGTRSHYYFEPTDKNEWEDYNYVYHFDDSKSYYYIANYGWDCMPWPCGLARHDIQLFTK